jgi:hypothetical protein
MAIGDIRVLLRRDACLVNATPVCRLYREIGLQFCNKLSERRVKAQLRNNRPHRGQADLEYVLADGGEEGNGAGAVLLCRVVLCRHLMVVDRTGKRLAVNSRR